MRAALNFVLADKVDKVLETALVRKDPEAKAEIIMPMQGNKTRAGIRQ